MDITQQHNSINTALERQERERVRERAASFCTPEKTPLGTIILIRGIVPRVTCVCGAPRWDDGKRCHSCGKYYKAILNLEDEDRF